jgi:hypothetical protein
MAKGDTKATKPSRKHACKKPATLDPTKYAAWKDYKAALVRVKKIVEEHGPEALAAVQLDCTQELSCSMEFGAAAERAERTLGYLKRFILIREKLEQVIADLEGPTAEEPEHFNATKAIKRLIREINNDEVLLGSEFEGLEEESA